MLKAIKIFIFVVKPWCCLLALSTSTLIGACVLLVTVVLQISSDDNDALMLLFTYC